MNFFKLCVISLCASLYAAEAAAITMPAPPPELSDTLTQFRTKEQLDENRTVESKSGPVAETVELPEAPFVPGDVDAGVMRNSDVYSPEMSIGIPYYGSGIVRFYDLNGVPWDITSVRCETQGFMAEVTASPSELLIKQNVGATSTKMVVELLGYASPLVFTLSPVKLAREDVAITTTVNVIKIKSYTNALGYVYPEPKQMPVPNPKASAIKFDSEDLVKIENTLVDAVRGINLNENQ